MLAVLFVVGFAGALNVGVYGCPTCTTVDHGLGTECNGDEPTYCGGGLVALGAVVLSLTALSFAFGLNWAWASLQPWETRQTSPRPSRSLNRPVVVRIVALTLLVNGGSLAVLGLWTTPNFCLPIEGPCYFSAYLLTGIPLLLVIVGWMAYAAGVALSVPGLARAFRERRAGPLPQ